MLRRKRDILAILILLLFILPAHVCVAETPVAKVGELSYSTLPAALAAAGDYDAVRLLSDAVWDEAAALAAKAKGLKIESFDIAQPKELTCTTDISLQGALHFRHLVLRFAPETNIYAQGHNLVIEETVTVAGPHYPILYGGGTGGALLGANLIVQGGTYAGIFGGGAGPPESGQGANIYMEIGKNAALTGGGRIGPGNADANYPAPYAWLVLTEAGSAAVPFAHISPDFSELTLYGSSARPCHVRLDSGDGSRFSRLSLGDYARLSLSGDGAFSFSSFTLQPGATVAPRLTLSPESTLQIASGGSDGLSPGVWIEPQAGGGYDTDAIRIEAPPLCRFSLLSPSNYRWEEQNVAGRVQWRLAAAAGMMIAPSQVRWNEIGNQIQWRWEGDEDISGFSLALYRGGSLLQSFSLPPQSGALSLDIGAALAENGPGDYRVKIFAQDRNGLPGPEAWSGTFHYLDLAAAAVYGLPLFSAVEDGCLCLYPDQDQFKSILAARRLTLPPLPAGAAGYRIFLHNGLSGGEMLTVAAPSCYAVLSAALFSQPGSYCFELTEKREGLAVAVYRNSVAVPFPGGGFTLHLGVAFPGEMTEKENYVACHLESGALLPQCIYDGDRGYLRFLAPVAGTFQIEYNEKYFSDIADDAWYGRALAFMSAREIIQGVGTGRAAPDNQVLRADFLIMVMRSFGIPVETGLKDNFSDAGATYYSDYLATAKKWGIADGTGNNRFHPKGKVTREEMFKMLYGVLLALDRIEPVAADLSAYSDRNMIHSWGLEAIMALHARGDIGGWDGKLHPTATAPRSHAVQLLYNLLSKSIPEEI